MSDRFYVGRVAIVTLAIVAFVSALVYMAIPPRPQPRTSVANGIAVRLRQIEGAKEIYANEHNLPPGSVISREQLLQYVPAKFWDSNVEYHINVAGVGAEAVLRTRIGSLPAKTLIRPQTNNPGHYEVVRPKFWSW